MCRLVPVSGLATDPEGTRAFVAWAQVLRVCARADMGEDHDFRGIDELREAARSSSFDRRAVVAVDESGTVVGAAGVVMPLQDNLRYAFVQIGVLPSSRRAGIGTELHHWVLGVARDRGRTALQAQTVGRGEAVTAGEAFAPARGWHPAQHTVRYDLAIGAGAAGAGDADAGAGAPRPGAAGADRYEIRTWADGVPEAGLADRAHLAVRMSAEIPLGDLALEAQAWDVDRMREEYDRKRAMGRATLTTVAIDRGDRRLVGFTEVELPEASPDRVYQQDTLVLPEHRGGGLGARLKRASTAAARERWPSATTIRTWNAAENTHMRAVNHAIGYRRSGRTTEWQLRLG